MELNYEHKTLYKLYTELFNREYSINDDRSYDSKTLIRHIEMQNVGYIFESLGVLPFNHGFSWDNYGPYSSLYQKIIREIDKSEYQLEELKKINREIKNAYYRSYNQQLRDIFPCSFEQYIEKVATTCYLFEDIINEERASEVIAGMTYLVNTVYPNGSYELISDELSNRGYNVSDELKKEIWKNLGVIGLREIEPRFTKVYK